LSDERATMMKNTGVEHHPETDGDCKFRFDGF
jgi:hypothetical protein